MLIFKVSFLPTQGPLRLASKKLSSTFYSIYFSGSTMCSPSLHPSAATAGSLLSGDSH